jgi:hypothetical protein
VARKAGLRAASSHRQPGHLPVKNRPPRRVARPLADLVDDAMAPALAAQGFAASDVVVGWPEIVGEKLARFCEPVKLQFPRKPARLASPDEPSEPATLVVRVESAFALELQHLAPLIIERVNTRYGWRCVGRLALRQGPLDRQPPRRELPPPPPEAVAQASRSVGEVQDEGLRDALVRLGAGILAAKDR